MTLPFVIAGASRHPVRRIHDQPAVASLPWFKYS